MNKNVRNILICGLFLVFLIGYFNIIDVSFAEEFNNNKKTYEQLESELKRYKDAQLIEAGFRTIDIIFGWNNVFQNVGNLCDSIINVLDSAYLWTPIKWSTVFFIGFFVGIIFLGVQLGLPENLDHVAIMDYSELARQANHDVSEGAGFGIYIKDKDIFIESVLTNAGFEKGAFINDLTGKVGDIQCWKVKS